MHATHPAGTPRTPVCTRACTQTRTQPLSPRPHPTLAALLICASLSAPGHTDAHGQSAPAHAHLFTAAERPDEQLDALRGGFVAPGGLRMHFGIERAVMVNGVLQSTTHLRVEDLGQVTAQALEAGSTVAVIQNGANNGFHVTLPATSLATIVQNSLDNQRIQTVTTVNATINSAEVMRGLRMHQSMQEALNRASLMR